MAAPMNITNVQAIIAAGQSLSSPHRVDALLVRPRRQRGYHAAPLRVDVELRGHCLAQDAAVARHLKMYHQGRRMRSTLHPSRSHLCPPLCFRAESFLSVSFH